MEFKELVQEDLDLIMVETLNSSVKEIILGETALTLVLQL